MDKSSGELVTLTPNNNNTVQPVALMRLSVFVPTLKSLKNSKNTLSRTDATEELTRLSLARAEGFDKVEITGSRLDMDNDFKTWVGIIHSFARHKGKRTARAVLTGMCYSAGSAMRHGSSSLTRLTGQSAMTP
ncbi:hypothetical protein V6218_23605, partial [Escherichia coli]